MAVSGSAVAAGDGTEPAAFIARALEAELTRDGGGRHGVVSRDHLDLDAGAPAGSDGAARLGAGRIDHRHEAEEGELRDVVVGGAAGVRQAAARHHQHAQALGGEAIDVPVHLPGVEASQAAAAFEPIHAAREQGVR
jgi:hypothetical protein